MTRTYDLVMTHKLDADDLFIHRVQERAARTGLKFFLIEPLWAAEFLQKLLQGKVGARVLLNMHSEHHDPRELFHRLVLAASRSGTAVIDPPDVALRAFNKALMHPRLASAGVHVPRTIFVPRDQAAGWRFTNGELDELGVPFVIKPTLGYGRKGVILNATSEADLQRSVAAWPNDDYLLQQRIVPRDLGGQPAYFRVYHVFSKIWICWWNCYTDRYREATPDEVKTHGLEPLEHAVRTIAGLSGMRFFSTEFAQAADGRFIAIDYVNDQCHMLSQGSDPRMGVPDAVVAGIAEKLVDGARELLREKRGSSHY